MMLVAALWANPDCGRDGRLVGRTLRLCPLQLLLHGLVLLVSVCCKFQILDCVLMPAPHLHAYFALSVCPAAFLLDLATSLQEACALYVTMHTSSSSTGASQFANLDIWVQFGQLPNKSIIHLLWGSHKTPAHTLRTKMSRRNSVLDAAPSGKHVI